jgi:syntaxin 8
LFDQASKRNQLISDDDDDEPIINNAPIEQIRSEQKQIIRQQDDSLDNLSKAISRQKQIAIRIGGEVDRQNDILDDIADQMDQTSARVDSTTRGVVDVSQKDSTWSYWAIIITLFIAIIIVLIL